MPFADDLGQGTRLAGLAGHDLPRPALVRRIVEVDAVVLIVREDDVEVAVLVEVDEAKPGVAALLVDEACPGRQSGSTASPLGSRIQVRLGTATSMKPSSIQIDQPDAVVLSVRRAE